MTIEYKKFNCTYKISKTFLKNIEILQLFLRKNETSNKIFDKIFKTFLNFLKNLY